MTIVKLSDAIKLRNSRAQPNLWFTPYSVPKRLRDIHSKFFPDIPHEVEIYSVNRGPLACICESDSSATIYIHQVLNHGDTPIEVVDLFCKHELLHLRIPPVVKNTKRIQHPPEFWEEERRICPERNLAWDWIWHNHWACLKRRPRLEKVDVLPNWRKVWSMPKLSPETIARIQDRRGPTFNSQDGYF